MYPGIGVGWQRDKMQSSRWSFGCQWRISYRFARVDLAGHTARSTETDSFAGSYSQYFETVVMNSMSRKNSVVIIYQIFCWFYNTYSWFRFLFILFVTLTYDILLLVEIAVVCWLKLLLCEYQVRHCVVAVVPFCKERFAYQFNIFIFILYTLTSNCQRLHIQLVWYDSIIFISFLGLAFALALGLACSLDSCWKI